MNGVPPYSPHSYGFVRQYEAPAVLPELSRLDAELLPELHRVLYRRRSEARALEEKPGGGPLNWRDGAESPQPTATECH